jgi:ATP-dependent helicase HrpB
MPSEAAVSLSRLPIDDVLPELLTILRQRSSVILRAPTGAGKTTRVPVAMLDQLPGKGTILMLEPRRLAARSAARRMASERGQRVGEEIGYHVRFERESSRRTRVLVVTPGILLRRLLDDPYLEGVDAVLFDEFHERGLESDLTLGLTRLVQQTVRPELRLVLMSATLDTEALRGYLGDCQVVVSEGRLYPVEMRYQPPPQGVLGAVRELLESTPGDVLVFLPGVGEIRDESRALEGLARERDLVVLPLHGEMQPDAQDEALRRHPRRKVVLATNVAETSVTVEGITGVVDTGLARQMLFDPDVGLDRLQLVPISRASAEQRAGRAGRLSPGVCVRLWSEQNHRGRAEQTEPEIRRVDLAGAVLHLLALGESDLATFPWPEPPPAAAVEQARNLLRRLGALHEQHLTPLGQAMARLPVHPRLGRLLLEGQRRGAVERAALAAALLSERDPFRGGEGGGRPAVRSHSISDVLERVEALECFDRDAPLPPGRQLVNRTAGQFVLRARNQLVRMVREEDAGLSPLPGSDADEALLRALLAAYPDRVVKRRDGDVRRGRMVGGRGVRLHPGCGVTQGELFLAADVTNDPQEALVRQASSIQRDWLDPDLVRSEIITAFDPDAEQVVARKVLSYEDLPLEESSAALPDPARVAAELERAARANLARVLPPADSPGGAYLTRLRCLAGWLPELGLPPCTDEALSLLLPDVCQGRRSFAQVRGAWLDVLRNQLSYEQSQALECEAPERLEVPSGSRITLAYEVGRPPVLAVRIQELFGLARTPTVARGRVPVLLHLLAPNYRPQQVTNDLASFWANTYPQVRKELRARYPRHAWPEDPLAAEAVRGPKRRGESSG